MIHFSDSRRSGESSNPCEFEEREIEVSDVYEVEFGVIAFCAMS
jgi:hypothetical protein